MLNIVYSVFWLPRNLQLFSWLKYGYCWTLINRLAASDYLSLLLKKLAEKKRKKKRLIPHYPSFTKTTHLGAFTNLQVRWTVGVYHLVIFPASGTLLIIVTLWSTTSKLLYQKGKPAHKRHTSSIPRYGHMFNRHTAYPLTPGKRTVHCRSQRNLLVKRNMCRKTSPWQ